MGAVEDCCNPEGYTVNLRPAELQSKTLSRTRGEEKNLKKVEGEEKLEGEEAKEKDTTGMKENPQSEQKQTLNALVHKWLR